MAQPTLVPAQVLVPSSFLEHLNGDDGRRLDDIYTGRLPVYEQERFERRTVVGYATGTGTGAAPSTFTITPPAEAIMVIDDLWIEIGATALTYTMTLTRYNPGSGGLQTLKVGRVSMEATSGQQFVGPGNTIARMNGAQTTRNTLSPVRLYAKEITGAAASDSLLIESSTNPGAAETLKLLFTGRLLPPDAEMINGNNFCSGTP